MCSHAVVLKVGMTWFHSSVSIFLQFFLPHIVASPLLKEELQLSPPCCSDTNLSSCCSSLLSGFCSQPLQLQKGLFSSLTFWVVMESSELCPVLQDCPNEITVTLIWAATLLVVRYWDTLGSASRLWRAANVKGQEKKKREGGEAGSQILFKPFVIYTGIYLSLKNNKSICGTIRSLSDKKMDT